MAWERVGTLGLLSRVKAIFATMHFSIWKSTYGQFYWEIKADNSETIAVSELYRRKESAEHSIALIKAGGASAGVYDHSKDGDKYDRDLP